MLLGIIASIACLLPMRSISGTVMLNVVNSFCGLNGPILTSMPSHLHYNIQTSVLQAVSV